MVKSDILKQLAPAKTIEITVEMGYGRTEVVVIAPPTWHEWMEVGEMIADPVVPRTLIAGDNKTKLPNTADVTYQANVVRAGERRAALRLTYCLVKAGHTIPGDTLEEQADALTEAIDQGIARSLYRFMESKVVSGEAHVAAMADHFPAAPGAGDAPVRPDGMDA